MAMQQRQTAYKVWISNLLSNEYVIQSGEWEPNYINIGDKKVSRVNIIANVIDKHDTDLVSSATIDDGSGSIPVRCFNENIKVLRNVQVGDLVLIVGRPRENNNKERFIVGEIARKLDDPKWTELRRLELKELGYEIEKNEVKENNIEIVNKIDDRGKEVLEVIRSIDDGGGTSVDDILSKLDSEEEVIMKTIKKLLEQGEIYENRPNRLKTIE